MFRQNFSCSALLENCGLSTNTGLSPCFVTLSIVFLFYLHNYWPVPRSLATTNGVSFDVLSYRYLDVSVPYVRLITLFIHVMIPPKRWVFPFGYPRIKDCSHLPVAFRSVLRPSSPPDVKASTKCPFALVFWKPEFRWSIFFLLENCFHNQKSTNNLTHVKPPAFSSNPVLSAYYIFRLKIYRMKCYLYEIFQFHILDKFLDLLCFRTFL